MAPTPSCEGAELLGAGEERRGRRVGSCSRRWGREEALPSHLTPEIANSATESGLSLPPKLPLSRHLRPQPGLTGSTRRHSAIPRQ